MLDHYFAVSRSNRYSKILFFALAVALLGLIFIYHGSSAPINSQLLPEFNLDLEEYSQFLAHHHKSYKSEAEFLSHFVSFRSNLAYIRVFNSQNKGLVLGKTCFADLSLSEYQSFYKTKIVPFASEIVTSDLPQIPSSVNWVSQGAVSPVSNQGQLGLVTDFVVPRVVASAWFIAGHTPLVQLSTQELIDCSANSDIPSLYAFVVKHGLTSAQNYPGNSGKQTCNMAKVNQPVAKISSYANVTPNNAQALQNAIANVPVLTPIDAGTAAFQLYMGGVISSGCGTNLDHVVIAVGYDLSASTPYYLIQNSWGTGWGESGYAQIGVTNGQGVCGIQIAPSYPVV